MMRAVVAAVIVILVAVLVTAGIDGAEGYRGIMVGAKREVKDVKSNREIQDLGRFCVKEFNSKAGKEDSTVLLLSFKEVVVAQTQVVSGLKYYLTILAAPAAGPASDNHLQLYDAAVVVKPWLNRDPVKLLHFRPSSSFPVLSQRRRPTPAAALL